MIFIAEHLNLSLMFGYCNNFLRIVQRNKLKFQYPFWLLLSIFFIITFVTVILVIRRPFEVIVSVTVICQNQLFLCNFFFHQASLWFSHRFLCPCWHVLDSEEVYLFVIRSFSCYISSQYFGTFFNSAFCSLLSTFLILDICFQKTHCLQQSLYLVVDPFYWLVWYRLSCTSDESEFPCKWIWWYNRLYALYYYVYQVLFTTASSVQQ